MTTADDFKCYHAPWVVRILLVIYTYIYPCHLRMCWPWWDVILCWHLWCWWAQKTPQERESHPTPTLPRRPYPTAVCAHIVVLWMFSRFLCIGIVFFFFFWLECNCFFCVRFCCSTKWISYVHTYISHLGSLSHPRPHPTPLELPAGIVLMFCIHVILFLLIHLYMLTFTCFSSNQHDYTVSTTV